MNVWHLVSVLCFVMAGAWAVFIVSLFRMIKRHDEQMDSYRAQRDGLEGTL